VHNDSQTRKWTTRIYGLRLAMKNKINFRIKNKERIKASWNSKRTNQNTVKTPLLPQKLNLQKKVITQKSKLSPQILDLFLNLQLYLIYTWKNTLLIVSVYTNFKSELCKKIYIYQSKISTRLLFFFRKA
jgi:hypothetical protein